MRLLRALLAANWAIEPSHAERYLPFVAALLQGRDMAMFPEKETNTPDAALDQDGIMTLAIAGPLMKMDGLCGEPGMASLAAKLAQAANDPAVRGIVLIVDSPGGSVDGTEALANAVRFASRQKPVFAVVDNLAASAAYWAIANATKILVASETAFIGSIGVVSVLSDFSEQLKSLGVTEHRIYATESADKNKDYELALKGNYEAYRKNTLDPLANLFIGAVKTARPQVQETALHGRTYIASQAIAAGLADAMGDTAAAKVQIVELTKESQPKSNMTTNNARWGGLAAFLGLSPSADKALNSADLDRLEVLTAENDRLKAALNVAVEQMSEATQEAQKSLQKATETAWALSIAEEARDEWKAKATLYGALPGDQHRKPVAQEAVADLGDKREPEASWDNPNLPWNKRVDANPHIRK